MKKGVNKKWIIIGLVLLAVVLIVGAVLFLGKNNIFNQSYENNYVGESKTIIHKDFRAVIKADWQETEIPPSTYVYIPPNTAQDDINAEVIYVAVSFLGENNNFTLDELLEQGIENTKQSMPDFELTKDIDESRLSILGKRIEFTGTQEGIKRNNIQVFGIEYNNVYTIAYSCPVDNCNYYAIYNSLVESFEPVKAESK